MRTKKHKRRAIRKALRAGDICLNCRIGRLVHVGRALYCDRCSYRRTM